MTNILEAIVNISKLTHFNVKEMTFGNNRANNLGDGLETFIKDVFSSSTSSHSKQEKVLNYSNSFSFEGIKNHPPDLMIKGGDAIEVKKVESVNSNLQLNSSHPKSKLLASSPFITEYCRNCEEWQEKDIIYIVGHVKKKVLSSLWFTYGNIYAADENLYTNLKETITNTFDSIDKISFSETKELGRINFVDPLRITNMRIRGMWLLKPPKKVYDYIYKYQPNLKFQLVAIMPTDKYYSFPKSSINKIESSEINDLNIEDVNDKNPNNPVNLIPCKLITIKVQ